MLRCVRPVGMRPLLCLLVTLSLFLPAPLLHAGEEAAAPAAAKAEADAGGAEEALAAGWTAYREGRVEEAEERFAQALAAAPANAEAHYALATIRNGQARYREAFAETLEAIRWAGPASERLELCLADVFSTLEFSDQPEALSRTLEAILNGAAMRSAGTDLLLRLALARALRETGKTEEAAAAYGRLPYLREWFLLGPFANREREGFETDFGPEASFPAVDLAQEYAGRGRAVRWTRLARPAADGYVDGAALFHPGTENIFYAFAEIESEADRTALALVGTAGAGALWTDRGAVAQWESYTDYHPLQRAFPLVLRKGKNRILVKVAGDREGACGFSLLLLPCGWSDPDLVQALPAWRFVAEPGAWELAAKGADTAAPSMKQPEADREAGLDWGLMANLRTPQKRADPLTQAFLAYLYLVRNLDDWQDPISRPLLDASAAALPRCPFVRELASVVQIDGNAKRQHILAALEIHDGETAARELLSSFLHESGFAREAEAEAIALVADHPSADAYEALAEIRSARGWIPEAYEAFCQALGCAPGRARLYQPAADAAPGPAESLDWLRKGVERTGDPGLRLRLGQALEDDPSVPTAALVKLVEANLLLAPYSWAEYARLARLARRDGGGAEEAMRVLDAARPVLFDSPELLEALGRLRREQGEEAAAAALWRASLAIRPDNPELQRYLKEIEPERVTFYTPYRFDLDEILAARVDPADHPRHSTAVLLDQGVVRAHENGSRDLYVHFVRQALRPRGAQALSSYSIPYSPGRERLEVLSATVRQPDGSVISADDISDRSGSGGGEGAAVYSQYHYKAIRLPHVRPGSIVEVEYVIEATAPNPYGDHLEEAFFFGSEDPTLRFQYVLDVPDALGVRVGTSGAEALPLRYAEERAGGRTLFRWEAEHLPGLELEPGMPPYPEVAPHLRATSFADWNDVAQWYWRLSRDSLNAPDELAAAARAVVAEARTDEEKIAAIYYFVVDTVRYVGIELGRSGYVPHKAEETWRTRYGDCKDTAALFVALLREAGIEARIALVRTRERGREPVALPGAELFNHAIAVVPGLQGRTYWLDGTSDYNHFDELPVMDQGASALVTGPGGGEFVTIPEAPASANSDTLRYAMTLAADGSALIEGRLEYAGAYAPGYRRAFEAPDDFRKQIEIFLQRRFAGSVLQDFQTSGSDLHAREVWFSFRLSVPHLAVRSEGGWKVNPWLLPQGLSRTAGETERKHDLLLDLVRCRAVDATLRLPEGATLAGSPGPLEFAAPAGRHARRVAAEGEQVRIEAETELPVRRIPLAEYAEFRAFCHRVDSSEEEWVLYRLPGAAKAAAQQDADDWTGP